MLTAPCQAAGGDSRVLAVTVPATASGKQQSELNGQVCSLLFSLPEDQADLNNDALFLVTGFPPSYTLIITNYQSALNTSIGCAFKVSSIKVSEMFSSAAHS